MNSQRLYFQDSFLSRFEARVVRAEVAHAANGSEVGSRVVLDRTGFYPEGGGQPADRGRLGEFEVLDVQEIEGEIVHTLGGPPPAVSELLEGRIDMERRFDHMQQHTGQHLLSRVFLELLSAETVAFHLGSRSSTIDLPLPGVTPEQVAAVEDRVAEVLRADPRVTARIYGEHDPLPGDLRRPAALAGDVRVVTIEGVDHCPCGGTHVARAAEIEAIVILRVERIRADLCRVEFLCGGRARADHRAKIDLTRRLIQLLSVEEDHLARSAERLIAKLKVSEKRVRELERELVPVRVAGLLEGAVTIGSLRVVCEALDPEAAGDPAVLARELAREQGLLVFLAMGGDRGRLVVAASQECGDRGLRADELLRRLLDPVGGKGGGSAGFAQGGFPAGVDPAALLARGLELARSGLSPGLGKP